MCDPLDAAKDAVSDAVAKTLEKPVDNLLGPITKDVGLALGDVLHSCRALLCRATMNCRRGGPHF
jgi:hypothetical protein